MMEGIDYIYPWYRLKAGIRNLWNLSWAAVLAVSTCGCSSPKTPVDKVDVKREVRTFVEENFKILPDPDLAPVFLEKSKVPKHAHKRFLETYSAFYRNYSRIPDRLRYLGPALVALNRVYRSPLPRGGKPAHDSTAVAFAFLTGSGIRVDRVGDPAYVENLAQSYHISNNLAEEGIWSYLTMGADGVADRVIEGIETRLHNNAGLSNEQYVAQVLLPYLTFVSNDETLLDGIENRIAKTFDARFSDPKRKSQVLKPFVKKFRAYLDGKPFHTRHQAELNRLLTAHDLYLFLQEGHASVYRITDRKINVNHHGIGSVLPLRRLGMSLLPALKGFAAIEGSDVIVILDMLERSCREVLTVLEGRGRPIKFTREAADAWKELGIPVDISEAQAIYQSLVSMAFAGKTQSQIIDDLFTNTSIHELRHKWDQRFGPRRDWVVLDYEVSAYATAGVLGPIPEYNLAVYALQLQDFYLNQAASDATREAELVKASWNLAVDLKNKKIDRSKLRTWMRKHHRTYKTIGGKRLPPMGGFETEVFKRHLLQLQAGSGARSTGDRP